MSELPSFEPYVAQSRLAQGPTTELYLARHARLGRMAWILCLREHVPLLSPFAERLERQGQLLARIEHPNVLGIVDCVKRPPRLWLVLDAVDGWNLQQVLEAARQSSDRGRLEMRGALAIALQVARGLAQVHDAGIVHAGIRPEHILVSKQGQCRLSGFALALDLSEPPPTAPEEPGEQEVAYLSPEQTLGEALDERSDLFSLGSVLYELSSGRRPFAGDTESEILQQIRHHVPPPLRASVPEIAPELDRIVQRCLEKQRERRFASAAELVRPLEHVLGSPALADLDALVARALRQTSLDVPAAPPGTRTRADEIERREARRGFTVSLWAFVAFSAAMLLVGAGLFFWVDSERLVTPSNVALATEPHGELLVVAHPWAHVFVNGKHYETTPFAQPITLPPGLHHVRLEHPNAPVERRPVELFAGRRVLLSVDMQLGGAGPDAGVAPLLARPDAGAAASP